MNSPRRHFISIVVPAFKQEKTIKKNIKNLIQVLSSLPYKYELIVVVDGSTDKTYEEAKSLKSRNVKVFGYKKNHGKGYAVKYGMLRGKGDIVGFIDAGMDINPTGIALFIDLMDFHKADIVIGSKLHPESKVNYPIFRRVLSWGYRLLTHFLFGFNVKDTQVGIKFFRRNAVEEIFPRLIVKQFAFDVEILAVAESRGFSRIYEGPVELDFRGASNITSSSFWVIISKMLWDTMAIFYRLRISHYYDKRL